MANLQGYELTVTGRALLAKAGTGACTLNFTKVKLGADETSLNDLINKTDLVGTNIKQIDIVGSKANEATFTIIATVTNSGMQNNFLIRQVGIFAKGVAATNPGTGVTPEDINETLFAVAYDTQPDIIPAESITPYTRQFNANMTVTNVEQCNVTLTPSGVVTVQVLNNHNDNSEAHGNLIKRIFGSTSATMDSIKNKINDWAKEVCLPLSGGEMTGDITANNVYANNNVLVFNNVADMKASNKVKAGYTLKTLGFYTVGDGGGADYVVTDDIGEDEVDEASIITLQKELYAKLLVQDYVNVKWFGTKADNETDDTEAINKAISFCKENETNGANGAVIIPKGTYAINSTIYLLPRVTLISIGEVKINYNGESVAFSVDASYSVNSMQEMAGLYTSNSSGYIYLNCINKSREGTIGLYLDAKKDSETYYEPIHPHFKGLVIANFYTSIKDAGNNVYFLQFTDCVFTFGVIGYQFGDGLYSTHNSGERCTFTNCLFSQLACCFINWGVATINLINCSLDYSALGFMCYFTTTININNCHMEGLGSSSLSQLDYEGARGFLKFDAKQETEDLRTKCFINMNEVVWVLSTNLEAFKVDATRNGKVNINANSFNISVPEKNIFGDLDYIAYFFPKDKVILNLQNIQKTPSSLSPFNFSDIGDMYFPKGDSSIGINANGTTKISNGWSIYGNNTNNTKLDFFYNTSVKQYFLRMIVKPNETGYCSVTIPDILVKGRKISAVCQVGAYNPTKNFSVTMYAIFKDIKGNYVNGTSVEEARIKIGSNYDNYNKEEIEARGERLTWSDIDYSYINNIRVPDKAMTYDLLVTMQVFEGNNNSTGEKWYQLGGFQVNTYD